MNGKELIQPDPNQFRFIQNSETVNIDPQVELVQNKNGEPIFSSDGKRQFSARDDEGKRRLVNITSINDQPAIYYQRRGRPPVAAILEEKYASIVNSNTSTSPYPTGYRRGFPSQPVRDNSLE